MAFATKYRLKSVSDVFGGIEIDLQKDGYLGSVTELTGIAPNAATLKIGKNSQNIFEPILSGELELLWYIEDTTDTLELATDAPRTWLAIVKQQGSGDEIWRGWISPESYQEQYTAQPYAVSVIANDALEELKASKFTIGTGKDTLWDFLRQALAITDIDLPFKESINIYDTAMTSAAGDSPLVQAEAENVSFEGITREPSNYQALAEILRPFGARIFQWAGHWHIENIYQKSASYVERVYNAAGVYQSQSTVNPLVTLDKTMPDFRALIGQSGAINTVPAIQESRIFFRSTPGPTDAIISGFATNADWSSSTSLTNWTEFNSPSVNQKTVNREFDSVNNQYALELTGRQTSLSNNKYIQSGAVGLSQATFEQLYISFWQQMNWPTIAILGGKPIFYVQIELDAGGGTKYYWRGEWIQDVAVHLRIDPSKRRDWKKFETTINAIPADGDLRIRLYTLVKSGSDTNTWVQIGGFQVVIDEQSALDIAYEVDTGSLVGELVMNPYDLELYFADGPTTTRGGALSVSGTLTSSWSRRGKTDNVELKRLYLLQFLSMHQRPTLRLQGTMYQQGEQIAPWQTVQDNASISTRKYVMTSYTLGLSNGQGQVIYRELIHTDASPSYLFRLSEIGPVDIGDFLNIGLPNERGTFEIPGIPTFDFNLNGDVSGDVGVTILNPSAIVEKTELDITTPPTSSNIVINAVPDTPDTAEMTKITAKDFIINAYASKATPVAADRLVISDSEDSDELKVISISDLPGGGGDTVTGDETRGIEVTEPTAGNKVVAKKYYNVFESFTASVALELKEGRRHIFTATSDFTLANPTNVESFEGRVEIIITQGLGGGHQITAKGDRVIFPNGTIPTLNSTFGESDWLRGICVNGYLLIYQIESLAAPGIDIEPVEPIEPTAADLVVLSYYKEDASITNVAEAKRDSDDVAFNVTTLQGNYDQDNFYDELKTAPLSPYGYGSQWNDQTVNSNNAASGAENPYYGGIKNLFATNRGGIAINSEKITSSNLLSARDHITVFWVIADYVNGRVFLNDAGLRCQVQEVDSTFTNVFFRARRLSTDAAADITVSLDTFRGKTPKVLVWDINYQTGDVELWIDGVSAGTTTLASTGQSENSAQDLLFGFSSTASAGYNNYYFAISENLSTADRQAREQALIDRYIPTGTFTGQDVYELFDLIVSPDRYGHSPYAANIRESTTNTEEVISHDSTTGLFDTTAFDTHVGAGNGFVTNIKNQLKPWEAFTQTTAARQLQLVKNIYNGRVAMLGNQANRTSMQFGYSIDIGARQYYLFVICTLDNLFTTNRILNFRLNTFLGVQIVNSSGAKLQILSRKASTDSTQTYTGATTLSTATPYLFTVRWDFVNGINQAWVNSGLEINQTGTQIGTMQGTNLLVIGNALDNSANTAFQGKIGPILFYQGEITSAQRIAIESELMNTYGIT